MRFRNIPFIGIIVFLSATSVRAGVSHTFSLDVSDWTDKPKTVSVAGDFNDWDKQSLPLHPKDNVWTVDLALSTGSHGYKFLIDGDRWINDPKADPALDSDDGNGGKNSGVKIDANDPGKDKPAIAQTSAGYVFTLDASLWDHAAESVNLAGDFNGWDKQSLPMAGKDGVYSVTVPLANGKHQYKFLIDGERWISDPKADPDLSSDDGQGGHNSGMSAGPPAGAGEK